MSKEINIKTYLGKKPKKVEEKSKEILVDLEKDLDEIFYVTSLYQIPYTRTVAILEDIIQFTLENDNQYIY